MLKQLKAIVAEKEEALAAAQRRSAYVAEADGVESPEYQKAKAAELEALEAAHEAEATFEKLSAEVKGNAKVQAALRKLRRGYGLPISFAERFTWFERQNEERERLFLKKIAEYESEHGAGSAIGQTWYIHTAFETQLREIAEKYRINLEKWGQNFYEMAVHGKQARVQFDVGMPKGEVWVDDDGKRRHRFIIDDSVDATNPFVWEMVATIQRRWRDVPPEPVPFPDNPRKLDWRPTWEWKQRHPKATHEYIASVIGRTPGTVRKKLAELNHK